MYHSVIFSTGTVVDGVLSGKNTWADWHLIPTSRPVIAPPKYPTKFIEIPGRAGSLDISNYLTTSATPGDRTGTIEFLVVNEYPNAKGKIVRIDDTALVKLQEDITSFLRGRRLKMSLEDAPAYYYDGRFWVSQWSPDPHNSKISIEYHVDPTRYLVSSLVQT